MKLKLKNYTHNSELTLKQFIRLFLKNLCDTHSTFTEEDILWCGKGKDRSIRDVVNICKYYYPLSNKEMVKDVLLSFGDELVGMLCDDINDRIVSLTSKHNCWKQYGANRLNSLKYSNLFDSYGDLLDYRTNEEGAIGLLKYKGHQYFSDDETSGIPRGVKIEHNIH